MQRYVNRHTYAAVFTALLLSFFSIIVNRIQGHKNSLNKSNQIYSF